MNEIERIDVLKKLNLIAMVCRYDLESEKDMRTAMEGIGAIIEDILGKIYMMEHQE